MRTLAEYYAAVGYPPARWLIGPEHPSLEDAAIHLLGSMPAARVLEIGYQAGGFAVPVILALRERQDFRYLGVDSGVYENAVPGEVIGAYLAECGVRSDYRFCTADAGRFVAGLRGQQFDLVLLDHYKPLYPRELFTILDRGLVSPGGVILIHDVLGRAARVWRQCRRICDAFNCTVELVPDVVGGLAAVQAAEPGPAWERWAARGEVEVRRLTRWGKEQVKRVLRPALR